MHALCWPLLTAADGTKIGKTTGARVWLDPDLTSPYAFFQHWINTDDAEVRRMLAQFTLLPMAEVDALARGARRRPAPRAAAQRALAREVTELVHGPSAARQAAEQASDVLFGADPRAGVAGRRWPRSRPEVPVHHAGPGGGPGRRRRPRPGAAQRAGWPSSQGDARRQLEQGGVSVNGEKVDPGRRLGAGRPAPRPLGAAAQGQEGLGGAGSHAQRVDTFPDPPIGCPSAPRRPRQRRAASGRATPAPPLH